MSAVAYLPNSAPPRVMFGHALIGRLVERAAEITAIPSSELTGLSRQRDVAWTRFAVMAVARERGKAYAQIGRALGNRNHSSVMHGIARAYEIEVGDPDFAELMRLLRLEGGPVSLGGMIRRMAEAGAPPDEIIREAIRAAEALEAKPGQTAEEQSERLKPLFRDGRE